MDYGKTTNDTLYERNGSWLRFKTSSQPLPVGTIRIGFMVGHNSDHTLKTVDPTGILTNRGTWTYVGVADEDYSEIIEWQSQVWDFHLTSNVTDWSYLFSENILMLTNVVAPNIIDANAYGVTTMEGMFKNSAINNVLSIRNTESCLNTSYMFYLATKGTIQGISGLHFSTPNCLDASYMFYNRYLGLKWDEAYDRFDFRDTAACTNMSYMFYNVEGINLVGAPPISMNSCVDASYMFYETKITTFPYSTANVQNMAYMLYGTHITRLPSTFSTSSCINAECALSRTNLVETPLLDLSHCTNTKRMFYLSQELVRVNLTPTCLTENVEEMFMYCQSLKYVNAFDISHTDSIHSMFQSCDAIESIPLFDTSTIVNGSYFAYGANSLKSVPLLNTSRMTNVVDMFGSCLAVEHGALDLYNQMSTQTVPPRYHNRTFQYCGSDTTSGSAELAQIPSSWGGTGT